MQYCSDCGARVTQRVPPGENRPRYVCDNCGRIHYENPRVVTGCVPETPDGRILFCLRANEPRRGFWTVPGGFLENGETLEQGAARECHEEALAHVTIGSLLAIVDLPQVNQVQVFFRARLDKPVFGAGPESLEVKLIEPKDIPWNELAFRSTRFALERYLEDRAAGREQYHQARVDSSGYTAPARPR